jgi:ubiquinone/menaquinone biosynthesis C-methylase UbiE
MAGYSHMENHDTANQAHFDRWARDYDNDRTSPWFRYTQELAISFLDLQPRSKVLDVGCGTGFAVLQLAALLLHGKACGIDISSAMIDQAHAKVPSELQGNVEFLTSSSDQIPYASGTFDHVLCTNSFHHYLDPLRALHEMSRVLRPGGQLVILENAPDLSLYTRAWDYMLRIIEKGHVRYYRSQELGEMLHRAGFERVRLCHLRNHFLSHRKLFASIQVWRGDAPRPAQF